VTLTVPATTPAAAAGWVRVCALADLEPGRGVAALVGGRQVALFRVVDHGDHGDTVYAVDHRDPFSGANVIARGIVGTRGDTPTVASPMHKQVFDLRTGQCLDDAAVSLTTHLVRIVDGDVEVHG
jgi:nitrite reductase (NADH) small subunit